MSFLQILQMLRAHWRVAALVPLAIILVATLINLQLPKQYTATTSLLVDVRADPIAGALGVAVGSPGYMATQTDIIMSDRVAQKVVSMTRLDKVPLAVERWREDTGGRFPLEKYWGDLLKKGLEVKQTRGSNIITLSYTARDPKFVAAVANAFAQAYIGVTIDLRVEPARQHGVWFDEREKELREALEAAKDRLSAYQKAKGIAIADERFDQESARLAAVMGDLAAAQTETAVSLSRQKTSGDVLSPEVQQDPAIQGLRSDLAKAELQLASISTHIGANHPQRVQLETAIAGLRKKLTEEAQRVSGTSVAATRVAVQRENELRAMVEAQKQRVLALRGDRDELAFLMRDVESAQRAYDLVIQRISQTSLESRFDQPNVRVLSPAVEPITPSGPKWKRNIAAAVIVGLMLGLGLALGLEFLNRRVRSPEDLSGFEGVPLLVALQPKSERRTFKERADEFGAWFHGLRRGRRAEPA
ncbi:MAG: chain length determinant protein EpsF [Sulfuritalea sp.]|nr:chain length determinant protein EpsF [Sulfuritalea sp.]